MDGIGLIGLCSFTVHMYTYGPTLRYRTKVIVAAALGRYIIEQLKCQSYVHVSALYRT